MSGPTVPQVRGRPKSLLDPYKPYLLEFDADGFRPGRRRAEQGVRALLNNLEFQGSLERRLPVILATPCAHLGPLAEVYRLPGNANQYTTTGASYISTLGDDQITLVRVPRA